MLLGGTSLHLARTPLPPQKKTVSFSGQDQSSGPKREATPRSGVKSVSGGWCNVSVCSGLFVRKGCCWRFRGWGWVVTKPLTAKKRKKKKKGSGCSQIPINDRQTPHMCITTITVQRHHKKLQFLTLYLFHPISPISPTTTTTPNTQHPTPNT